MECCNIVRKHNGVLSHIKEIVHCFTYSRKVIQISHGYKKTIAGVLSLQPKKKLMQLSHGCKKNNTLLKNKKIYTSP